MIEERAFKLSADELVKLAAAKLSDLHSLQDGKFRAEITMTTDGKSAELQGCKITFEPDIKREGVSDPQT